MRERESAQAGQGQRERETQNLKQASGPELSAQSPMRGMNPWMVILCLNVFFLNFFKCFYLFFERERETEHEQGKGRERGRHRI